MKTYLVSTQVVKKNQRDDSSSPRARANISKDSTTDCSFRNMELELECCHQAAFQCLSNIDILLFVSSLEDLTTYQCLC